jgi:16S rRNA (guanine527-N7)-methyltransferase
MTKNVTSIEDLFGEHGKEIPAWLDPLYDRERLIRYYNFLVEFNERGGFFSARDSTLIFERHFYESLIFAYYVSTECAVSRETEIADAGTGPGLPGYLFSCLKEMPRLTLIDSSKRRLSLLEAFHVKHYVSSVKFDYSRVEELKRRYDIVVSRALVPFPHLLEILIPAIKKGGVAALSISTPDMAGERIQNYITSLGYVQTRSIMPVEFGEGGRSIQIFQKKNDSRPGYPRSWHKIKEEIEEWRK